MTVMLICSSHQQDREQMCVLAVNVHNSPTTHGALASLNLLDVLGN